MRSGDFSNPVKEKEDGTLVVEGCIYPDCDFEGDIEVEDGVATCPKCHRGMEAEEKSEEVDLSLIWERLLNIDSDVFEIHEAVIPDEDRHEFSINVTKTEIIAQILIFGFVFLLGMVVGGLVL